MKFEEKNPAREYQVGVEQDITIKDCGQMHLEADEQITFVDAGGGEYDVAKKSWGYYATPSINGRLESFNYKTALCKNKVGRYYVLLVEASKEDEFFAYLKKEQIELVAWLNDQSVLDQLNGLTA